jgi:hypothetical protein
MTALEGLNPGPTANSQLTRATEKNVYSAISLDASSPRFELSVLGRVSAGQSFRIQSVNFALSRALADMRTFERPRGYFVPTARLRTATRAPNFRRVGHSGGAFYGSDVGTLISTTDRIARPIPTSELEPVFFFVTVPTSEQRRKRNIEPLVRVTRKVASRIHHCSAGLLDRVTKTPEDFI